MLQGKTLLTFACCICCLSFIQAEDWNSFRGPKGNGISQESGFPVEWGPEKNMIWKVKLPGAGNGSPIVSEGKVFLTTSTANGQSRTLHCFNREDGKELWKQAVQVSQTEVTHKTNPYAGTTPAADGKHVVVWHGSAGLYCYDFTGKELWKVDLGTVGHIWGYGSSPVIHDNKVYLNFGPGKVTFLVCLDLENGKEIWKQNEPGGSNDRSPRMVGSWSTPVIVNVDGESQVICSMPTRVVAWHPENGNILWSCKGLPSERGDLVYTSILYTDGFGVAMGGYKGPSMGFLLAKGSGDVTETHRKWRVEEKQPQRIGSGVIVGDYIYMANAGPGTAQCLSLKTGETIWEKRLIGDHWASLVFAGGNLYATNQQGRTTVFKPNSKEFQMVSENKLQERMNATPAFSDGQIFLRSDKHLYCVGKK